MVQHARQWSTLGQWQEAFAALTRLHPEMPACIVSDGADLVLAWDLDETVSELHSNSLSATIDRLTPGWWAGFIGFEAGGASEPTFDPREPDDVIPPLWLGRFASSRRFRRDIHEAPSALDAEIPSPAAGHHPAVPSAWELLESSLDRSEFCDAVADVLLRLHAGECFELNLTRRLTFHARIDPVEMLRQLVTRHPAPHAAFLRTPTFSLVSPSPELLASWEGNAIETRPIKGTSNDAYLLANSPKDRAENIITVDVARADVSKICIPESLRVDQLCELEAHPGLWHLVSTVTGVLDPAQTAGTMLQALLPAASITGSPKPRVLQIIRQLEPVRRDAYCGSIGFIDTATHRGALNVAIRTLTHTSQATMLGVGGGITLASDPNAEWEETELKADRLLRYAALAWDATSRESD